MARPGRFNRAAHARQKIGAADSKGPAGPFLGPNQLIRYGVQQCVSFCVATLLCNTPLCRSL